MEQGYATTILTIYNPIDKLAIVQVEIGQFYGTSYQTWEGTMEDFLLQHPDYKSIDDIENEETI